MPSNKQHKATHKNTTDKRFVVVLSYFQGAVMSPFGHRTEDGSTNSCDSEDEFYPYIRCALCCGFFIDATTITECLHTFCKSCIVKHFFHSNRCPTCSIIVHQTQPLYNIRPDRQLQDIVYKMVPLLEELEREQMCKLYRDRGLEVPEAVMDSPPGPVVLKKQKDSVPQSVFTIPPELDVSLLLEFVGAEGHNFKLFCEMTLDIASCSASFHCGLDDALSRAFP
ncbi:polycomb group RING finger protein 6-like [Sphaeramia orbicularis]|uniref:polycomb group RING finger protein 6-like n=1 Tax=Sphaeramia orbicularis TaxID=375764 RepID=UPI00117EE31A|nr:polycomb group RING finger protein 6-like [Sphaeramia orbicularis]